MLSGETMLGLFKSEPVLDEESILWLFDIYSWALDQFGEDVFFDSTRLVLPTNDFFPGRENSAQGMADLILDQVADYASIGHWPLKAVPQGVFEPLDSDAIAKLGRERGESLPAVSPSVVGGFVPVPYEADMVLNPEALIASYAHVLSHYLGAKAEASPPGGAENWVKASEVLGVFMGFGIMMANSAFHVAGGCGSCSSRMATRTSYLSQYDTTYALAIFAALKGLNNRDVSRHLKTSLRGYFKRAIKDVMARPDLLHRLQDRHAV